MPTKDLIASARDFVLDRIEQSPQIALILGSGLADFADQISDATILPAADIPHYPIGTVAGHHSKLVFGSIRQDGKQSKSLLVFKGRVHYYESADEAKIMFPVLLAKALGCQILLVTNAAGGINRSFTPGDLMLLTDTLNLTFLHPTSREKNTTEKAVPTRKTSDRPNHVARNLFDGNLQQLIRTTANQEGIKLQEGIYCWLKGPSYETAAEIEMLHRIGVDAVGMSTVPELLVAKEIGLRSAGISLISNLGTGITGKKLSHEEVTETGEKIKVSFSRLLKHVIFKI